jgi:PAT family beta-lactamase induction signal transducer AmpG
MTAMIAVIFLAVLFIRERPKEKLLPWLPGEASEDAKNIQAGNFKEIMTTVGKSIFKVDSLKLIAVMLLTSIAFGLYTSAMPKIASDLAGWSTQDYSSLSGTANLTAGFLCVFVFGFLANKLGRKKVILFLLVLQCILVGWALLDQGMWSTSAFVNTTGFSVISIKYGLTVALSAIAMGLCNLKVSATQFTLYMACSNLGLSIAYAIVGSLDKMGGYQALISAFACVTVIALIVAATLNENVESNLEIEL